MADIFTPEKDKIKIKTIVFRFFLILFTVVFIAVSGLIGGILILEYGPSEKARDLFVVSVMETSAAKFLATAFLGEDKVNEILNANSLKTADMITDTDLVVINPNVNKNPSDNTPSAPSDTTGDSPSNIKSIIPGSDEQEVDPDGDGIDIVDIKGAAFKGKMMIVYDPTRVFVGVSGIFGEEESGRRLMDIYSSYGNVVAATNGGGWVDDQGTGSGGIPDGIVISQGKVLWGTPLSNAWECCGITEEGKLVVGTFTVQQALDMGITNAVKYGPSLIINNQPLESLGTGSGLNPRTAIGQRADGAMLLLVLDGRQSDSLGASYVDIQDIMLKFEAVNAYNLDGGSSTSMIYKGEFINKNNSMVGYRKMCTAILVKEQEND